MALIFTNEKCIGCNKCIHVCSCMGANIFTVKNGKNRIEVDEKKCIACGACIDACEHKAREFKDDTNHFFNDLKRGANISVLVAPALKANYPDIYKNLNFKQKPTFYVIPGLIQSAAIKYTPPGQGQPGIAYDMDPQGLAIIDHKYLIISAYSKSKTFDSVLWVLDFKTGRFVKTIALNNIDHVGGITYDEDHKRLWVATINQEQRAQVQSVPLKEIEKY